MLRDELLRLFRRGAAAPLDDAAFDALARRICERQLADNAVYAAYARRRGVTPGAVPHWSRIPGVPTAAFKELPLVCGEPSAAQAVFRTSGTTRGVERRGAHHVLDLALYDASLLATFRALVLPDGARPRVVSLVPSAGKAPDSSLSYMIGRVIAELAPGDAVHAADRGGALAVDALDRALRDARRDGAPVCILGTTLAFAHWLDAIGDTRYALPRGSRIMDTGGFKGRERVVEPAAMRAAYARTFGIPGERVVNEYGMTELLSQYYDRALVLGLDEPDPRAKSAAPWLRCVAADPETLEPLPPGETGLLRHVDLANLDSVVAVQTEDLGYVTADGDVVLFGRAPGAAPRGCSIAMDMLLDGASRP